MPSFELEDTHGNKYTETTRKHLPARLVNELEALYNAKVYATRQKENVESGNVMQARSEVKDKVIEWLNDHDFENSLGPDNLAPVSQDKVLKHYQEYLPGINYENSDGSESGTGKPGGNVKEQG